MILLAVCVTIFIYNIDSNASPTSLQDMYEVNRLKDEEVMIFKKRDLSPL